MQTFLPYPDFNQSARCLDRLRLGKQRSEAKTILRILTGELPNIRWRNHPAVRMWRGHEMWLCFYGITICTEWQFRGYKDSVFEWFIDAADQLKRVGGFHTAPPWFGSNAPIHTTHRAALLAKDFDHYKQFGWKESPRIHYFWPV